MISKKLILGIISLSLIIAISAIVLAVDSTPTAFIDALKQGLQNVLSPLFSNSQVLSRVFLGILLAMIIFTVLDSFLGIENKFVVSIISLIITVIAFLGIPASFIDTLITQYAVMGGALLSTIPFLILLLFTIKIKYLHIARITWIFYCVYYFALFAYKWVTLGWNANSIPYFAAMVAGIIIFFFIGPIRNFILKGEVDNLAEKADMVAMRRKALIKAEKRNLEAFDSK